jgi:hypothetical protein
VLKASKSLARQSSALELSSLFQCFNDSGKVEGSVKHIHNNFEWGGGARTGLRRLLYDPRVLVRECD